MKKILNALFLTLLAVFTFSSCSDVPAPYDILGEGDVPGLTGDGTKENPYSIEAARRDCVTNFTLQKKKSYETVLLDERSYLSSCGRTGRYGYNV